ncbi:A-kinase anchor protein 13 isoform X2 [Pleurodeles waltl]|uniref:A-kinase anchor protein 13 isoform X2 n=1 Tax=Pleurodeles waltl TaxID=8319 RepID=UPI0037096AD7
MKLNPQQAPLYGDSVLTVLLSEEDELEDDVVFFLLFAGSNLNHLASTKKVDTLTLKTIAPGHDCCEAVKVSLCASKKDIPVLIVAEETFQFVQDEASDAAQFLASSAGNQQALIFTRFLDKSRPASGDASILDGKITLAFRHLSLPEEWNVLGTDKCISDVPRETLMHFAVRLDLLRLVWFLLQQPGGRESLSVHNNEGATPVSLALERGYQKLHKLLTDDEPSEPESWSSVSRVIHSGDFCVKHHRDLNVYTLTQTFQEGCRPSLDDNIGVLRKHIQKHSQQTNASMQSQSEPGASTDYLKLSEDLEQNFSGEDHDSQAEFSEENKQHASGCVPLTEMITALTGCIGEADTGSGDTTEAHASDTLGYLGGVIIEPSSESANQGFEPKKEEAGPIVAAEGASHNCDGMHSTPVEESGVEIPPSCGNTSAEDAITLTAVVSNKESLREIDNPPPEVIPPRAVPSINSQAEETGSQGHTFEEFFMTMGQTVASNSTESVNSGQTQACTASGKQDNYQDETDFVNVQSCQEDAACIGATDLTCDALGSGFRGDLSGAVDSTALEQEPTTAGVSSESISPDTKLEEDVKIQVTEAHSEGMGIATCVELCVDSMPCEEAFHDKQLPQTNEGPSAHSETPEISDNLTVEKVSSSGDETVEAENKNAHFESTKVGHTGSTCPGEDQNADIKLVEQNSTPSEHQTPHEYDKSISLLKGGAKNNYREQLSSGDEVTSRTEEAHNAVPTEQEMTDCNTVVEAAQREITALDFGECSTVYSPSAELQAPSAVEVSREADKELMQSQTCLLPHDSGPEQQLHRPSGDIILDASAIELVREEVVQETELGSVSTVKEDELMSNAETSVGAPSTGNETAVPSDSALSTCTQSKHEQDSPSDTPLTLCDNRYKGNQDGLEHAAAVTQHTDVILENALSSAGEGKKDLRENSPFQTAVSEETEPNQVVCESGTPASDELLSTSTGVVSFGKGAGKEPETESSTDLVTVAPLRGPDEEINSDMAVDAKEGAARDLVVSATEESQTPADDSTLDASLEQECDLSQSLEVIAPCSNAPESIAQSVDCEETSQVEAEVHLIENAGEESVNVKIPRVSLHPIAEEPLSGVDSSQDTTSSSSESEVSPRVKEFGKNVLEVEDDKDNSNKTGESLVTLGTPRSDCVAHPENASVTGVVKDSIVSVEFEDSINTKNVDQEFEETCSASSPHDICSLEVKLQSSPRSHTATPTEIVTTLQGDGDSGLGLTEHIDIEDSASVGGVETMHISESLDMKCEDEVDFAETLDSLSEDLINRESWCSAEPCPDPQLLENKNVNDSTECESFLEDGLGSESTSSQGVFQRDSGSDSGIFHLSSEAMDDMVFAKPEEEQSTCDITSSSSSADDTISLERTSSRGSDISLPCKFNLKKHKNRHSLDSSCSSTAAIAAEGQENEDAEPAEVEGEEKDSITEAPVQVSLSRNSVRSLSPFRRHSWGPGKNTGTDTEINQRSSMRFLGDVIRKSPIHRRSMSWCPSDAKCVPLGGEFNYRSYSLEGLVGDGDDKSVSQSSKAVSKSSKELTQTALTSNDDGSSFLYLKKGDLEATHRESRASERLKRSSLQARGFSYSTSALSPPLTKSMSLVTIHHPGLDTQRRTRPKRRLSFSLPFNIPPLVKSKNISSFGSSSSDEESDSSQSLNSASSSLAQSISEESCNQFLQSPSRKEIEGKGGIIRTFSYFKNKMSSKKPKEKEKDKDKAKEKEKDAKEKEKDKKTINGHHFTTTPIVGPMNCYSCIKTVTCKEAYLCSNCNSIVHKGCRESYASCAMVKMKQPKVLQAHDTSSLPTVVMRNKNCQTKERPRSAIVAPDENTFNLMMGSRRPQTSLSLSKSVSIQNIAGAGNDENHLNAVKYLSRSTDSLNKMNTKVTESMESLNDEGTDMNEGQLMGDFEMDSKQLEAESWSQAVDSKFLRQQKKEVVKRQDVIYELMQTEMHHVRTLKIMSDVYSRGMVTELQFEQRVVEKIFPCLEDLLKIHSQFFQHILDRRKECLVESSDKNYVIKRIGDLLVQQFSGENAERMKKTYGKFCGHHNEAVNYFKDLHSKEKRFQAFMKKKMSSTVVRRLGIQECILLVTQRITKYPVILQRILQYTKENEVEHEDLKQSLLLVKDVITAVNSKVNNYEKKMRLHEIYSRTDSKSIQRMKGGKMFAKEDLKRRKLIRDGPALLKTATGRLKEAQAVLLSDTLVFLQEKDQKYVFASLEHRSTVISLKRLIVRDVAHEEKGLFLISMGEKDPEMVEVHTSSKEERNSWMQVIQDTITTMGKDEDEGIPSESEEERKILDTKSKELKEQLEQKDKQILTLLNEKECIFRNLCCGQEDSSQDLVSRALFRASTEEALKGEEIVKTAIKEVETLQDIVTSNLGNTHGHQISSSTELGVATPVSLPRRAETFGGFDSHQMTTLKNGDRDEVDDNQDLRRTESDSVLKKGGNANFMLLLKRNSEQVLCSVSHLHKLLSTLQAVVIQQDTYIEDQKLLLNEKTISRTLSKPNSLIEQEKQRSLEKQRQELANLQKQQAQHLEEKRKREREWESREKELAEREVRLAQKEEKTEKGLQELEKEREELQARKEQYQRDLERLRAAQKQLEKETEQLKRDMEQDSQQNDKTRTSSMTADCLKQPSSSSPKQDHLEPPSPKKDSLFRTDSKQKGKGPFHLLSTTNQTNKPTDRLFSLSKPKEKKEKKKKNKGGRSEPVDCPSTEAAQEGEEIFC